MGLPSENEQLVDMQYRGDNFLYGGIDFSVAGEGGQDCISFLSPAQRLTETLVFGLISLALIAVSWRRVSLVYESGKK